MSQTETTIQHDNNISWALVWCESNTVIEHVSLDTCNVLNKVTMNISESEKARKKSQFPELTEREKNLKMMKLIRDMDASAIEIMLKSNSYNRHIAFRLIEFGFSYLVIKYLDKFEYWHDNEIARKIISTPSGWWGVYLLRVLDKFHNINHSIIAIYLITENIWYIKKLDSLNISPKLKSFINRLKWDKDNLFILSRLPALETFMWCEKLLIFYVENKQKSLVPLTQKLLTAKDIGLEINFEAITDLLDTSWIQDTGPKVAKEQLGKSFDRLLIVNLEKNEETFDMDKWKGMIGRVEGTRDMQYMMNIVNNNIRLLWLQEQTTPTDIVKYYDRIQRDIIKIRKESMLKPEEFARIYSDLQLQVQSIQSKRSFDRFLQITKIFDDKAIIQLKSYFSSMIEEYFDMIYKKKVREKFVSELWLGKIDNLDEIIQKQEILEWFKMYKKAPINKEQFKQILVNAINGNDSFVAELEKNKNWLATDNINGKDMKKWTERNEGVFDIGEWAVKMDRTKDIQHFVDVANNKLKLLWLEEQNDAGKLVNYYNTEVKKKLENIKNESTLPPEEFESIFNDLALQINSINNLFKQTKAKEITQIKIYKETDPAKVLMMGNVVDGSCLSSSIWNFWSTATNALDINKWVFYIQDQNDNIIGRVLTAIDNDGKLLRFRMYKKWNIEVDLDRYFNKYIKQLAENIRLWLGGDINQVELLNGEDWYKDPVQDIE